MLQTLHMPIAIFKKDPKDLFFFFEDFANFTLSNISNKGLSKAARSKLQEEFYVVSVLNALFGNPNIHLVQLHPEYRGGRRNYDKMRARFADVFDDDDSHEVSKKRRNALTEAIRFISSQEYPITDQGLLKAGTDEAIYRVALHHLFNGDVKASVDHLNAF